LFSNVASSWWHRVTVRPAWSSLVVSLASSSAIWWMLKLLIDMCWKLERVDSSILLECSFNGGDGVVVFGVQWHLQCIRSHPFFVVSVVRAFVLMQKRGSMRLSVFKEQQTWNKPNYPGTGQVCAVCGMLYRGGTILYIICT
jgi:hypothetical protein